MVSAKRRRTRIGTLIALLGAAAFIAGCGSSNSSSTATAAPSANAVASAPAGQSVAISSAKGSVGTYLTGASGRPLYLWVADTGGKSNCSGQCAKFWPPLLAKGTPTVSGGVSASDLGTIIRSDGSKQVSYKGHPLYYFVEDPKAGTDKGQGNNGFGAKWWLVAPSGSAITTKSSSGSSSGASSSGGYGGSGY